MNRDDYLALDGLGLADLVRKGEVHPSELVSCAIDIIEATNPDLNAVIHSCFDQAQEVAGGWRPGGPFMPFDGVPFLLKNLGALCKGLRTDFGSRYLSGFVSPIDDHLVKQFRKAGLVVLGNTNTPELGLVCTTEPALHGATRNPWDVERIPGGSSGGAAAAVAAGMVPIAHANDGGGSIRIPAACCGLVGLKPSRARVSIGAASGQAFGGLACDHVVSRTLRDSAAVLDAICGPVAGDPMTAPSFAGRYLDQLHAPASPLRIAVCQTTFEGASIDPEVAATVARVARALEAEGHLVAQGIPRDLMARSIDAFTLIWSVGVTTVIGAIEKGLKRPPEPDDLEPLTWYLFERGKSASATDLVDAWGVLHGIGYEVGRFMETYDVLLTPTLASPAVPLGTFDSGSADPADMFRSQIAFSPYTAVFNGTGQPSLSLPLGQSSDGLPIGVMLTGRMGDEATLLALGHVLEQAMPWSERRPPIWGQGVAS